MMDIGKILASGCALGLWAGLWPPEAQGDLRDYVGRAEPEFRWEKLQETKQGNVTVYDLQMVSQVWRGIRWQHRIQVFRPDKLEFPKTMLLVITGGGPGRDAVGYGCMLANALGAAGAALYQIPNQPLFDGLKEDHLIAHTFVKLLETKEKDWPLLLPMTKSAVKAMDVLQAFSEKEWGEKAEGFVVTGASKRGWTTWLTAAADERVRAIAPMVYDNLNLPAQMRHQREVYGGYSEQIAPYIQRGLTELAETDQGRPLVEAVDPYSFRERLKLPKLIINGTNDRYWTLDSLNLYWNDLAGEKHVLYAPNCGHGLQDIMRVINTSVAFFRHVAAQKPFVKLAWTHEATEGATRLSVTSDAEPMEMRLWAARSATKDFRDARWESTVMSRAGNPGRAFTGEMARPADGFAACFGEAVYLQDGQSFTLSTTIRVCGGL